MLKLKYAFLSKLGLQYLKIETLLDLRLKFVLINTQMSKRRQS